MNEWVHQPLKQSIKYWMSALKCTQPSQYCKQSYTVSITHCLLTTVNQCSSVFEPVLILLHLPSTCQPKRLVPIKTSPCIGPPCDSIMSRSLGWGVRAADRQLSSQTSIIESRISLRIKYTWKRFTEHLWDSNTGGGGVLNPPCRRDPLTFVTTHACIFLIHC